MEIKTIRYHLLLLLLLSATLLTGCSDSDNTEPAPKPEPSENEAKAIMEKLWGTSGLDLSTSRLETFDVIQGYADHCSSTYFNNYLESLDTAAENMEKYDNILTCYRMSFDKVLKEVESTQVESGTTVIWMLYNMGHVVKTPKGCFAVDVCHRYAEKLEPYLDFMCITHNHSDHYSTDLINKMFEKNKPVLSNYLKKGQGYPYTISGTSTLTIGSFTLTTNLTNHNEATLQNFVTTFRINCGSEGGGLILMHVGDSNYKVSQYNNVERPVDVFIARYAPNALTENNVIGSLVTPKYVFLSHILELAHAGVDESRWPISMGLERASKINCDNTVLPFWGEKLVWENSKLN